MKLVVLSRNRRLYSTQRLVEAAKQRGMQVQVVDPLRCYIRIADTDAHVHYRGRELRGVDAVIPRIGASITFYATAVVRQFEMMGVYTPNPAEAIGKARDKLRAAQLMSLRGIPMPTTVFGNSPDDTEDLLGMLGPAPHVLKLVEGTQGQGVVLADTASASESLIQAFRGLDAHFLLQEFIAEAKGADIRAFVIGNKVIAAMQRQAKPGEFRANLHRGGSAKAIKLKPTERELAVRAADALGLEIAGVDLIRSARGPLLLEVNASPGLEGIEAATGLDIAGLIVDYVARRARRHQRARRRVH